MKFLNKEYLVQQILSGMVLGVVIGVFLPSWAGSVGLLGQLFVNALKAVAPVLVFALVASAIANQKKGEHTRIRSIVGLYALGTLGAAVTAVIASTLFPTSLTLASAPEQVMSAPTDVGQVLMDLLVRMVDNPVNALIDGNFIGILVWAVALGIALHKASETTKQFLHDGSHAVTQVVQWVIRFAPLGILGLVAQTVSETGFSALAGYSRLIAVLLGAMGFVALVVNPLIVACNIKRNPYPLIFKCLRQSGVTAFFTRSSAANVPVNLALCEELGLHEDTYSVSIPLGATINMAGGAITITTLALAAAHTQGIEIHWSTAILLSVVASLSACGASGVAGGSLLLIPLACGLFGMSNEVAMQVVAIGFMISVIQDSAETALNSSTDVVFTAATDPDFRAMTNK